MLKIKGISAAHFFNIDFDFKVDNGPEFETSYQIIVSKNGTGKFVVDEIDDLGTDKITHQGIEIKDMNKIRMFLDMFEKIGIDYPTIIDTAFRKFVDEKIKEHNGVQGFIEEVMSKFKIEEL